MQSGLPWLPLPWHLSQRLHPLPPPQTTPQPCAWTSWQKSTSYSKSEASNGALVPHGSRRACRLLRNSPITRITPSDITRFQENLVAKGNSIRTIDNKTGALRALLGFAKKATCAGQPVAGRALLSKKQKMQDGWATFEPDEMDALLRSDFFARALIKSRLRYGSAIGFIYCMPGWRTYVIAKEHFKRSRKGIPFITIRESKTAAGIREVPLHPTFCPHCAEAGCSYKPC